VVLRRDGTRTGMLGFDLGADGEGAGLLSVPAAGNAPSKGEAPYVQMNGPEVYKFATHVVVESAVRCLDAAGLAVADVDLFLPHQANQRIIDHAARRLGIPEERVFGNVAQYGNTSAASIPLALDEAYRGGDVKAGDTILMVGFGGGLAWGSCVMEWTKER
jgi:3-oxoacyl-[acyl-carrier-protein] synthase III